MQKIFEQVITPKSGLALVVKRGQHLRVIDLEGKQVCDMAVFNAANPREKLSTSYSRTRQRPRTPDQYVSCDKLMEGDALLSTICHPMMTIVKETPEPKGIHECHNRMCNSLFYELHGLSPRDGCLEILSKTLASYGILPEDMPDTFDIFMNMYHDCTQQRWVIKEPVSRPGDYIEFRAEMDCLVGLSNCPEDTLTLCNAKHCTPLKVEVYEVK